jgi:hypothetical protein
MCLIHQGDTEKSGEDVPYSSSSRHRVENKNPRTEPLSRHARCRNRNRGGCCRVVHRRRLLHISILYFAGRRRQCVGSANALGKPTRSREEARWRPGAAVKLGYYIDGMVLYVKMCRFHQSRRLLGEECRHPGPSDPLDLCHSVFQGVTRKLCCRRSCRTLLPCSLLPFPSLMESLE